jgi:hypothetical protein
MFQSPHKLQEAYKKEKEVRNLKKTNSLKELSFVMTTCFKLEMT